MSGPPGSWFAQVFASRYPGLLRSVTLDSTYQVLGLDPWYTTTVRTARRAFAQACQRSAACAAAARGGQAWARIAALERRLARAPVSGMTTTADGTAGRLTVTPLTLVNLVNNAGFDPVVYQDLDAAARALLRRGATVSLASVGDEVSRWPLLSGDRDLGLRGGRVTFSSGTDLKITLRRMRWVSDAVVNGTAVWDEASGWLTARLTVHPDRGPVVRVTARWRAFGTQRQPAVVLGAQGGRRLAAESPAP